MRAGTAISGAAGVYLKGLSRVLHYVKRVFVYIARDALPFSRRPCSSVSIAISRDQTSMELVAPAEAAARSSPSNSLDRKPSCASRQILRRSRPPAV